MHYQYITYAPRFWKDHLDRIMEGNHPGDHPDCFMPYKIDQKRVDQWGAETRALLSVREDFIVCTKCGSYGEITLKGKKREICPKCEGSGYENFRESPR